MPISEAQKRANAKYIAEKRCKLTIDMSPAQRAQINDYCRNRGGTATYIKKLLRDDMLKNGVRPLEPSEAYVPEDGDALRRP